ncbi:MAG: GntR family transcriptional regulator [Anaerolineales bacterium]|nr:GntR family transcriptional regulator [Anaerolineales bacterium]
MPASESSGSNRLRPNVPIAVRAANLLRRRLRQEFAHGGRLPSEHEIAVELGISRGTVRQALAILQQEGVITRQQGSGTYANPTVLGIPARIDFAYEFGQLIENSGLRADIQTLEVSTTMADADAARRLSIVDGDPVLLVRKVFLADGQPAIYGHELLPLHLVREAYAAGELEGPIFRFIERRCLTRVDYILSELVPTTASALVASLLDLAEHTPLLQFVEVMYSPRNQPLVLASIYFRDPPIRFHALRKLVPLD